MDMGGSLPDELLRVAAAHAVECAIGLAPVGDGQMVQTFARYHFEQMFQGKEAWPDRHVLN